ncbi:hypothetical protein ABIB56_002885 [Glaciihabitans sp. UYNi722]
MPRVRTKGDALRRSVYFRAFNLAVLLIVFGSAIFSGSVTFAIVSGTLVALQIAIFVFYLWLFRHADPAVLAAPIDAAQQLHWRYLRPNKYPYEAPITSARRKDQ